MSGADFTAGQGIGAANLNARTIQTRTGTQIAAMGAPAAMTRILCVSSGSGFVAGVVYTRNDTNTAWIASSGLLNEVFRLQGKDLYYVNEVHPRIELWSKSQVGGTLANDDSNGGWSYVTSTALDNRVTMSKKSGARFDFGRSATMNFKINISTSVRILFRAGVGMDAANVFTNTRRMFGIEIDNNTDVAKNIFVRSSNGTTGSAEDTGVSTFTGADKLVRLEFLSGTSIKLYIGGTLVYTKTTNIPSSNDTSSNEAVIFVFQTRNTTSKTMIMMYCTIMGKEGQVW
jgi:hypothetical protein